jgi:hypothetical protein
LVKRIPLDRGIVCTLRRKDKLHSTEKLYWCRRPTWVIAEEASLSTATSNRIWRRDVIVRGEFLSEPINTR